MKTMKISREALHKALAQRQVFPGQFLVEAVEADVVRVRSGTALWNVPFQTDGKGGFAFGALSRVEEPVVTECGVALRRETDFVLDGRSESLSPAPARMVTDAQHDPERGDYHLIVVEAGATESKRRIITDAAVEGLPQEPYTGLKMFRDHDEPDTGKELGVRRVEHLVASVVKSWVVPSRESATGKAQAHAIAHVFPGQFAESMKDPVFRAAIGVSHVASYAGYIGKADDGAKWQVVTSIPSRHGVDFVTEAGARGRAAESAADDQPLKETETMDWTKITAEALAEHRPDLVKTIADDAAEAFRAQARESDSEKTAATALAEAERKAQEATDKLRHHEITDAARSAVTAETGIPAAVKDAVAERVASGVAGLPSDKIGDGAAIQAEVKRLVETEAAFIKSVAGAPTVTIPPGDRGVDEQSQQTDAKAQLKRRFDDAF